MLSRLADHLFWLSRYMERAENTARMLDVQHQAGMQPVTGGAAPDHWQALLSLYELESAYRNTGLPITPEHVLRFMLLDRDNPSSIWSCLSNARENARAVRTLLSPDLWESVNGSWLEMNARLQRSDWQRDPAQALEWVKLQSHLYRGVLLGTMLKDEAYHFCRIGTFLERADNTARILDVNYLAHQGDAAQVRNAQAGGGYYFWSAVLRSVSAFEIYRQVTRDVVNPLRVAELLIQRPDMPRSLLACLNELQEHLQAVAADPRSPSLRMAGRLRASLEYLLVDADFEPRMHDFLTDFLAQVYALGGQINEEFLTPLARNTQAGVPSHA